MWNKGYVQVYTGDGKGKTTAALGMAVRAAGAGLKVYFAQFVKGKPTSEHVALARWNDLITVRQFGNAGFIIGNPTEHDIRAAAKGLVEVTAAMQSGAYRLVVLDEANIATHFALFTADELIDSINKRHEGVEVIITGRHAHPKVIAAADLVTEMVAHKHYYTTGTSSRLGIEE